MKWLAGLFLGVMTTTVFASTPILTCVADDFSPIVIEVYETAEGYEVVGIIARKVQDKLLAKGEVASNGIHLVIGSQNGSIEANGFAGIYGVIPVTIPEYNLFETRMTCISEKFE